MNDEVAINRNTYALSHANKGEVLSYQNNDQVLKWFKYIFLADILLKWLAMYFDFRNGLYSAILYLAFALICLIKGIRIDKRDRKSASIILVFVVYNFLLLFVSMIKNYSLSLVLSEIANTIIPMIGFFVASTMSDKELKKFERVLIIVGILLLLTGIYYNVTLTDIHYLRFLEETNHGFEISSWIKVARLNSFFGSVRCGNYGCIIMLLAFKSLYSSKKSITKFLFLYFIGVLMAFLTLQRSAILSVVLFSFLALLFGVWHHYLRFHYFLLFVLLALLLYAVLLYFFPNYVTRLIGRVDTISEAIGERSGGWMASFSHGLLATIFGYGFATGGQRAMGGELITVNDGNYFKIIFELGLVGLLLFTFVVFLSVNHFIKTKSINGRSRTIYFFIILLFLFQMIGSNLLTFGSTAMLFWFFLGCMNKSAYSKREV